MLVLPALLILLSCAPESENNFFKRSWVEEFCCVCSSRTCILISAISIIRWTWSRLRNFVRIFLKRLKSLSQDAEFTEMERIRFTNMMNGESFCLLWPNWLRTLIGSGSVFCNIMFSSMCLVLKKAYIWCGHRSHSFNQLFDVGIFPNMVEILIKFFSKSRRRIWHLVKAAIQASKNIHYICID